MVGPHKPTGPSYGDNVIVDGQVGVLAPIALDPAEAAVSVTSLVRVNDNVFRATVADDRVLLLDRETLQTLPQGMAKLATLEVREQMQTRARGQAVGVSQKRKREQLGEDKAPP